MGKIHDYLNSRVLRLKLTYKGEKIDIDLAKELVINRSEISQALRSQPLSYGFLTGLHAHLKKDERRAELEYKRAYSDRYIRLRKKTNPTTNRPYSDDMCKEMANLDTKVRLLENEAVSLKSKVLIVESAIRSFEQKKDMLQTLSANSRKERE